MPLTRAVWRTLASVRVGLFLLFNLGGLAAFITVRHPSPEPYFLHPLYLTLLGAFGVNILCVLIDRFRFRAEQAGFLATHVGIVTVLAGGALTHWGGEDGQMRIFEGAQGDTFQVERGRGLYLARELRMAVHPGEVRETRGFDAAPPARLPSWEVGGITVRPLGLVPKGERVRVFLPDPAGEPCLRFRIGMAVASMEEWLQADHAEFGEFLVGNGLKVRFQRVPGAPDEAAVAPLAPKEKCLAFFEGTDGGLALLECDGRGRTAFHRMEGDRNLQCTLSPLQVRAARRERGFLLEDVEPAQEGREFLRVRAERGGETRDFWAPLGEPVAARVSDATIFLNFCMAEKPLGFTLKLDDFRKTDYEGSEIPMAYESHVRLDDPEHGVKDLPVTIAMNEPLRYRGWTFFQAAFSSTGIPGHAEATVLQVSRDPGKPVVYTGAVLVTFGIVFMFYLKPWMRRRGWLQAA